MTVLFAPHLRAAPAAPQDFFRRGPFAFHYAPVLSEERLAWYENFDVLVTHDPLPAEQVRRLHAAGTRLLMYEWSVAFYETRATPWQRSLIRNGNGQLLNTEPLTGGVGSAAAPAWYFDPASEQHAVLRSRDIARRLAQYDYDGVFFDTTRFESVHPSAQREYARRHPSTPFDAAFARFLVQLREQRPGIVIFTNQGYRSAEYYLPYVDWDLSESLITGPAGGGYRLRAWDDPATPWSSVRFVMNRMIEPLVLRYPRVRFAHLNYADGSHESIAVAVAAAQIFGGEAFVAAPDLGDEADFSYFRDPGRPLSVRVDEAGRFSYRFFENGLIVVAATEGCVVIPNPGARPLRDRATGVTVCGDEIVLAPPSAAPHAFFLDAVPSCGAGG